MREKIFSAIKTLSSSAAPKVARQQQQQGYFSRGGGYGGHQGSTGGFGGQQGSSGGFGGHQGSAGGFGGQQGSSGGFGGQQGSAGSSFAPQMSRQYSSGLGQTLTPTMHLNPDQDPQALHTQQRLDLIEDSMGLINKGLLGLKSDCDNLISGLQVRVLCVRWYIYQELME